MPRVSVIIATYNRSGFICDAVESVLAQTFKDREIIIIDDGSTDNTKEILNKYGSSLKYIYQENLGRSQARNAGIMAAQGEYIAFLDDDDIWLSDKLEKQVNFLDTHADIGLVHTFTQVIDEQGFLLKKDTWRHLNFYRQALRVGYNYQGMSQLCIMFLSSVMIRKECLRKIGLFDPGIPAFEDWDFYLRLALNFRVGTIEEALVKYRLHKGATTQDEFYQGRIKTAFKHLSVLDQGNKIVSSNLLRRNFYIHISNAYYINRQYLNFRVYARKAFKIDQSSLFNVRIVLQYLLSIFRKSIYPYPERITPHETFGGPLANHLKRYAFAKDFCKDKVVLDAACGMGYGSDYLADGASQVIGVDISQESIEYARKHYQRNNLQFKIADIHNLDFPDKYFDVVCSFETLEHLENPQKYLSQVMRVLKDGGVFIVSTPNVKKTCYKPKNPYHKVEFNRRDFQKLLEGYFVKVEIFGERRLQSSLHYYLQKLDILHLRGYLPNILRRKICNNLSTSSWDEAGLSDFVISKDRVDLATELLGVCYR